jgi:amino acid transporter
MPYCHKCGSEVNEENTFCPKCGANLKAGITSPPTSPERYRSEKAEKQEKQEKNEKDEKMEKGTQQEKYEKQEYGVLGPFVGGIVLILVGFMLYLSVSGYLNFSSIFPFFLIIVGVIIILGVLIGVSRAKGRNPKP